MSVRNVSKSFASDSGCVSGIPSCTWHRHSAADLDGAYPCGLLDVGANVFGIRPWGLGGLDVGSPIDEALDAPRSEREGLWADELARSRKASNTPGGVSLLLYLFCCTRVSASVPGSFL